jgi:hypothetical protein
LPSPSKADKPTIDERNSQVYVRVRVITQDLKVRRINPRHLVLAVRGDQELDTLMDKVVFPGGGVIPHIHHSLIRKRTATLLF